MVPLEGLGMVSCSPSVATMTVSSAVSEIFSVKYWHDFEIGVGVVQGR